MAENKEWTFYVPYKDADIAMCQIFTILDSAAKEYKPVIEFFDDSFDHAFGTQHEYHFELGVQDPLKIYVDITNVDCDFQEFMNVLAFEYKKYQTFTDKDNRVPPFIVVLKARVREFAPTEQPVKRMEITLEWKEY